MKQIEAHELQSGQDFRLPSQTKLKTVIKVMELDKHDHIPPLGRKILIMHSNCRQLSVLKDTKIIVR